MERRLTAAILGAFVGMGLAFAYVGVANAAPPQNQLRDAQLQEQLDSIRNIAQGHHLAVDDLRVEVWASDATHPNGSCTVSAAVGGSRTTAVTISATAETCADTAKMAADGVTQVARSPVL